MDSEIFKQQMERMKKHFANKYSSELCALIWREVKQQSGEWMTKTVDLFIGECERAPLLPQFREQISKERFQAWEKKKEDRWVLPEKLEGYLCIDCGNKGHVNLDSEGKPVEFGVGHTFRCHCRYGAERTENWPRLLRETLIKAAR